MKTIKCVWFESPRDIANHIFWILDWWGGYKDRNKPDLNFTVWYRSGDFTCEVHETKTQIVLRKI